MNVLLLCFKMYYICVLIGEETLEISEESILYRRRISENRRKNFLNLEKKLLNDEYNPLKEADFLCQKKKFVTVYEYQL